MLPVEILFVCVCCIQNVRQKHRIYTLAEVYFANIEYMGSCIHLNSECVIRTYSSIDIDSIPLLLGKIYEQNEMNQNASVTLYLFRGVL